MMHQSALDQLADALADEHRALLEQDLPLLVHASREKQAALQALEADPPGGQDPRLAALAEDNRKNGALLSRRRREVEIILRHLGGDEHTPAYNIHGQRQQLPPRRVLAVA